MEQEKEQFVYKPDPEMEGHMRNGQGHLVPMGMVKPVDQLRDETVQKAIFRAKKLQEHIRAEKAAIEAEIETFIDVSMSEHDVKYRGLDEESGKGNVSLLSFDGKQNVRITVSERIEFNENLQAAKALIDECIHEWAEDANQNIRALVEHAFQVDKAGKINTARVLGLRQLDITEAKWEEAMQAITDSIQVTSTKSYINFLVPGDNGKLRGITLNFSDL